MVHKRMCKSFELRNIEEKAATIKYCQICKKLPEDIKFNEHCNPLPIKAKSLSYHKCADFLVKISFGFFQRNLSMMEDNN